MKRNQTQHKQQRQKNHCCGGIVGKRQLRRPAEILISSGIFQTAGTHKNQNAAAGKKSGKQQSEAQKTPGGITFFLFFVIAEAYETPVEQKSALKPDKERRKVQSGDCQRQKQNLQKDEAVKRPAGIVLVQKPFAGQIRPGQRKKTNNDFKQAGIRVVFKNRRQPASVVKDDGCQQRKGQKKLSQRIKGFRRVFAPEKTNQRHDKQAGGQRDFGKSGNIIVNHQFPPLTTNHSGLTKVSSKKPQTSSRTP